MSADGRQWKKDLLRKHGVEVIEYDSDYSHAVAAGRKQAQQNSHCHFIDDENSMDLFLGYAEAASRLQKQLKNLSIPVDSKHPLFVYLPCGVGGGPGGISYGLKQIFGHNVYSFFAEPTHSPCMLIGLYTGLHDKISVGDFGLDNITGADGLAVGRPSGFISKLMEPLIDGIFTVDDMELHRLLTLLADTEGIRMEPSALAGIPGMTKIIASSVGQNHKRSDTSHTAVTHAVWGTGGSMVPQGEMAEYYQRGCKAKKHTVE
jgi:D-serine dehydratase